MSQLPFRSASSGLTPKPPWIKGAAAALVYARNLETVPRPVVAMAAQYPAGTEGDIHTHTRTQFLHSRSGVMTVSSAAGNWLVPPQYALWIPAGIAHKTRYCGQVQLQTLYLNPDAMIEMPDRCHLIEVQPLLAALVSEAMGIPPEYELNGREQMIVDLLMHEIRRMPDARLHAPMPADRRLQRICLAILADPGSREDVDHWIGIGNLSRRTMARAFLRETGMSFSEWRQKVRLLEAIVRLSEGQQVTTVAFDLGYESSSAFTAMFRRNLGYPPTEYLRRGKA
jgi:AraC-like DNA-binding protein/quercetin dioxygenase-like cupin family protein